MKHCESQTYMILLLVVTQSRRSSLESCLRREPSTEISGTELMSLYCLLLAHTLRPQRVVDNILNRYRLPEICNRQKIGNEQKVLTGRVRELSMVTGLITSEGETK